MAELTTIARPYAKAAFLYAQEAGALDSWEKMLGLAASLVNDPAMSAYLDRPDVGDADKVRAFAEVGGDAFDEACRNFLAQCGDNKRLLVLPEIHAHFHQLLSQVEKVSDVELTSAVALTDAQADELAAGLKKRLGCEVSITRQVDESLIGGVIVRAGDTVIDGSVRGKLSRLAEQLNS